MNRLVADRVPLRLRRLAFLWLIVGTFSAVGAISLALNFGFGAVDIGVLGLAFGPGLVLGWRWVRVAIRAISWVAIVMTYVVILKVVDGGTIWAWLTAVMLGAMICLLLEQLYILKLPEVRRYYDSLRQSSASEPDAQLEQVETNS